MAKKKLIDLTDIERHKLGILIKPNPKFCQCEIPHPRTHTNELFESWDICTKCNKEIL